MSSPWPEERAFRSALRDLSTSASRIGAAARLALHDPAHAGAVVTCLERYVKEAPPAQKLPVLYVVNQVCRSASQKLGASEPFTPAFTPRIAEIVRAALADCPVADQAAARRTVKLWVENRLFPNDLLIPFLGATLPPPSIPEPKTPPGPPPPLRNAPLPAALAPPHTAPHVAPQHGYYASSAPPMHGYGAPAAPPHSSFPPVPLYAQVAPPAPAWSTYQSQFDYGDEQDDDERLAEQKRRRLEQERRANESPPRIDTRPSILPPPTSAAPPPRLSPPPPSMSPSSMPHPSAYPHQPPPSYYPLQGGPPPVGGAPQDGGAPETYYSCTLFVGRLPQGVPREDLQRVFERFGRITRCVVLQGKDHGFVTYTTRQEAEEARGAMDGVPFLPGAGPMRIGWGREGVPPHLAQFFDNNTGMAIQGVMPQRRGGMGMGGGMGMNAGAQQNAWAAYEGR